MGISTRKRVPRKRPGPLRQPSLIGRVADTTTHRDRDALDHSVTRLLLEFLDACSVTLYRVIEHEDTRRLARRAALARGLAQILDDSMSDPSQLPAINDADAFRRCVERRRPIQLVQPCGRTRCVFPIEDEREVIGLLEVITDTPMHSRDAVLVQGMLRVLKNQLALLDYGERDTLTGLLNRKTFEGRFSKLGRGPCTAGDKPDAMRLPSWLGLLDIDHFKSINDRYGHLFGDEVLLLISQIMKRTLRGSDLLFRFGGEEFVIVLERVDENGAQTAFGRLRAAVEQYTFPQAGSVTISLGYTRIAAEDVPTTCIERADAALYYAKGNGRNNVCCYETLLATGEIERKSESGDVELF